jgi:protocatechuate 3,4-dioxygenase beta subunit
MRALFLSGVLVVLIGDFGLTHAQQAAKAPTKLALRAVAAESNEPIEGVSIAYTIRIDDGKFLEATILTGEDGAAAIEWPATAKVHKLWFTARTPKRVPVHVLWDDDRHPIKLPLQKELRFEPGTTIGGIVKDEAGRPIEGATVDVNAPATESERRNSVFTLGTARTDGQGRWRLDTAPKNLDELWTRVEHPRYKGDGTRVSRGLNSEMILKKGLTVTGRVIDAAGKPVRGARATLGRDNWAPNPPSGTTNERGAFTLENCDPGPAFIAVQVEGLAPNLQDVGVEDRMAPVEIRMTEPASVLRLRVVDVHGKPVAGATVVANIWRGHQSIEFRAETDRDGRVEWRSAPKDAVQYGIGKENYMWINPSLTASNGEQTITLYSRLVVSGRVTDAATGRPVLRFRVVTGMKNDRPNGSEWDWSEEQALEVTNGRYTVPIDRAGEGAYLRIDAPGYKPAVSRAFQSTEGAQTFDFALQPASGISGVVLLPDGQPAAGVDVVLATWQQQLTLRLGRFNRVANTPKTATGPDGRFEFPAREGQFFLIALGDAGCADVSSDEFIKSGKLVLRPWGRIEGGVRIGARLGANQEVAFQPIRPAQPAGTGVFDYGYTTQTDERGRFQFDRVIPGPGRVTRSVITELAGGRLWQHTPGWPEEIEVKPGQTVQVTIGGKGRPVIGRVVLDGTPETPVDWTHHEPVEINAPGGWYAAPIEKDGRFRIDDIPAGPHGLVLRVKEPDARFSGQGKVIGRLDQRFIMPEIPGGRSNDPLDLGTITVKLIEAIRNGDLAPDFDVERIGVKDQGQRVKLSAYHGKLVLLHFWQAWEQRNDLSILEGVQATFGKDPRFELISLACDKDARQAESLIKEKGWSWIHGLAGDLPGGIGERYKIRAILNSSVFGSDQKWHRVPLTFLIGPDGRVLGHDLSGGELEAVRKALEDPKVFATK